MQLIVDSGSSRSRWVLMDNQEQLKKFEAQGINPTQQSIETIRHILDEINHVLADWKENIQRISYYGSGCGRKSSIQKIGSLLREKFQYGDITIGTDLLGAARAVYKNKSGIIGILGTGSNIGLFDGRQITETKPGHGYIFSEYGSASHMGKLFLQALMDEELSSTTRSLFFEEHDVGLDDLLPALYASKTIAADLGYFARFMHRYRGRPDIAYLIKESIEGLVKRILKMNHDCSLPVSFTGSVAMAFEDTLKKALRENSMPIGLFEKEPINGLIAYHQG